MSTSLSTSSSQSSSDPWSQSSTSTTPLPSSRTVPASVPDDWENDDDSEEKFTEHENKRIWNDANNKTYNAMPEFVISPSASASRAILSPPAGAFQPTLRILKRPSNTNSTSSTPPPTTPPSETLKDREARYQAARDRIFGESAAGSTESMPSSKSSTSTSSADIQQSQPISPTPIARVAVVRNPRGPEETLAEDGGERGDGVAKGFGRRKIVAAPNGTTSNSK